MQQRALHTLADLCVTRLAEARYLESTMTLSQPAEASTTQPWWECHCSLPEPFCFCGQGKHCWAVFMDPGARNWSYIEIDMANPIDERGQLRIRAQGNVSICAHKGTGRKPETADEPVACMNPWTTYHSKYARQARDAITPYLHARIQRATWVVVEEQHMNRESLRASVIVALLQCNTAMLSHMATLCNGFVPLDANLDWEGPSKLWTVRLHPIRKALREEYGFRTQKAIKEVAGDVATKHLYQAWLKKSHPELAAESEHVLDCVLLYMGWVSLHDKPSPYTLLDPTALGIAQDKPKRKRKKATKAKPKKKTGQSSTKRRKTKRT